MKIANLSVLVSIFTTFVTLIKGDKHDSGNWLERTFYNDDMDEGGTRSLKSYSADEPFNNIMDAPSLLDDVDENDFFELPKKKKSKHEKSHRSNRHKHHKHKSNKRKTKSNRVNKLHTKRGMNADEDMSDWNDSESYYDGNKKRHHASHKHTKHSKHSAHHITNSEIYDPIETFRYEDTKDFYEEDPNQRSYLKRGNDTKKHSDESKYLYIPVETGNEFQPISDFNEETNEKDLSYLATPNNDKAYESLTVANETTKKGVVNAEDRVQTPGFDAEKDEDTQKQIIALHSQIQSFMPFFNDLAIISESAVFKRQLQENTVEPPHAIEERTISECSEDSMEKDGTKLQTDESAINTASSIFGQYQEKDQAVVTSLPASQCSATEIDEEPKTSLLSLINGELLASVQPILEKNAVITPSANEQDGNDKAITTGTTAQNMFAVDSAYLVNETSDTAIPNAVQNKTLGTALLQKQDKLLLLNDTTATSASLVYKKKAIVTPNTVKTRSTSASQQEGGISPLFENSAFITVFEVSEKKAAAPSTAIEQNTTPTMDIKPLDNQKATDIIAAVSGAANKAQDEIVTNTINNTTAAKVIPSSASNITQSAMDNQSAIVREPTTMTSINLFSETIDAVTTMTSLTDNRNTTKIRRHHSFEAVLSTVKDSINLKLSDIVAFTESVNASNAKSPIVPLALVAVIPDEAGPTTPVKETAIDDKSKVKNVDLLTRLYSFLFNL
ncbi:uncharacterized protein LOC119689174 isoform X2 [Teleopsis dalmanni]|uniref:uncharacterized protein LOC119672187 isoform X2 n=1 Tax=Teleopsis dalmanni TaxID=139649 RepID=UPI0018CDB149|nr:uncharacterized protein LOC119672187 isoform X2 [Teleopsis dalmanni]XP_037959874.1 uncharacterized protein LOC119689174 isoform X2 [Teleopsis dalmanni]